MDGSGNIWLMNTLPQTSTTGNGNALVEFVGAAAPTIPVPSVALQNHAIGTRPSPNRIRGRAPNARPQP